MKKLFPKTNKEVDKLLINKEDDTKRTDPPPSPIPPIIPN